MNEQLDYLKARLTDVRVEDATGGVRLVRWKTALRGTWAPKDVELFIEVPPAYPAQAPSGFDAVGPVTVRGGAPSGSGVRDVGGIKSTHFCWNPAGRIDYTVEDGVWRFARFCETRFELEQ